jgi:predicted RND superfamily exporter protein
MLPTDDRVVKVLLESIPISLDKSVYETTQLVLSEYIHLPENQHLVDVATNIFTELEDAPEELGMRVNIYANMMLEDAIAYKLYKWPS